MSAAGIILISYFFGGLFALALFDLLTHRIRGRFRDKAAEAQVIMSQTGNLYVGKKVMLTAFAVIMWLFWPFVILGALRGPEDEEQAPKVVTRADMMGAGLRKQLSYWARKIWYGECPMCSVILTPMDTWGQYSVCPVCKTGFYGIRMKARKEEQNGETRQGKESKDREGGGEIDIPAGKGNSGKAGEQPARAQDTAQDRT